MDAVELPLPADVVVSELLGAADRDTAGSSGFSSFRREKFRSVKLKHSQDSKRTDKKLLRASIKTKYDPLTSKTGFTTSDPISGGNSILGDSPGLLTAAAILCEMASTGVSNCPKHLYQTPQKLATQ